MDAGEDARFFATAVRITSVSHTKAPMQDSPLALSQSGIFGGFDPTRPNQTLQPTTTRCAFTFFMIKILPEIFSRAPGSRG
jgi:hypothetical protein